MEVRIAEESGRPLPSGQHGEIVVRGEAVFSGYFNDPVTTAQVLRDGWLYTGDVGSLDADGHLYVLGRKRALIKRAGALIAPREIEEAADRVDGVRFSAAVGIASEALGGTEHVVLVAEVRSEAATPVERAALAAAIANEVTRATGTSPGDVVLVAPRSIPRTQNGKIRYDELRELITSGELARRGAVLFGSRDEGRGQQKGLRTEC
jgi:acyl-CoA synthetase (AMP-forming)/AMP-acid ligase II